MARATNEHDPSMPSPLLAVAVRLHRHALESVFAFCSLEELAPLLRVSKEWTAAVQTMRPLGAVALSKSPLQLICASRLSRHIGSLHCECLPSSSAEASQSLLSSARLSHLHSLTLTMTDTWSLLVLPTRLRHLHVRFLLSGYVAAAQNLRDLDAAVAVIAALPMLESLTLYVAGASTCCLTPLTNAPALHTLVLDLHDGVFRSPRNIAALRNMPHLRSLAFQPSSGVLTRLVEAPHQLKLETFCTAVPFADEDGDAIVQLPTLTTLSIRLGIRHTDFLRQLPNLRSLRMDFWQCVGRTDTERIVESLHSLVRLTMLRVEMLGSRSTPLTSDHLAACLRHMPLLTNLHLSYVRGLDSLRFLSDGPITHSLKELDLSYARPQLPLAELAHIHVLTALTKLRLESVFDEPLAEPTARLYTPPSPLLPSLRHFAHAWQPAPL
jgi:hypothetical protein